MVGDTVRDLLAAAPVPDLEVEQGDDWESRKEGWEPNPPKYTRGVLGKYAKTVSSAAHGAVTG